MAETVTPVSEIARSRFTSPKTDRNKRLYEFKQTHQLASWREIAELFGVSRQRAYKIYEREKHRRRDTR